jgi:hypothetical protein
MIYGICTNQPARCTRARSRELIAMPNPDTRCPEPGCGKPLLPAPSSPHSAGRRISQLAAVVLGVALLGGFGFAALRGSGGGPGSGDLGSGSAALGSGSAALGSGSAAPGSGSSGNANRPTGAESVSSAARGSASVPAPTAPARGSASEANLKPERPAIDAGSARKPAERPVPVIRPPRPVPEDSPPLPRGCEIARGWDPQDSRLSTCEGVAENDCRRIKRCLGVYDSNMGPGIKKN